MLITFLLAIATYMLTIHAEESNTPILYDEVALITDSAYSPYEIQQLIEKNFGSLKEIEIEDSIRATPPCLSGEALPFSVFLHSNRKVSDLNTPLKTDRPAVHIIYPESEKENDWVFDTGREEIFFYFADNHLNEKAHALFIDNPITSGPIEPFYQLQLDEKEQWLIYDLIKTMAEKNIWGLLFKKKELEKIGRKINHVHPMRFIGYILDDPKLKKWLREIKTSSFKWDHFIDGFSNRMKEESAKNNLMLYIPGMAHLLNVDPERIIYYIQSKDYSGLVKALI